MFHLGWGEGREIRQVPCEHLLATPVEVCVSGHWICEPAAPAPALVPGLPRGQHTTKMQPVPRDPAGCHGPDTAPRPGTQGCLVGILSLMAVPALVEILWEPVPQPS